MGCIPPEGLFSGREARRWVVRARSGGTIVWVPQQVDVKGILRVDRKWLSVNVGQRSNDLTPSFRPVHCSNTSENPPHPHNSYLVLLASSLLIVVKDIVADVVLRLSDQQPGSFLHVVPSAAGCHHHSQQEEH